MSEQEQNSNVLKILINKQKIIISGNIGQKGIPEESSLQHEIRSLLILGNKGNKFTSKLQMKVKYCIKYNKEAENNNDRFTLYSSLNDLEEGDLYLDYDKLFSSKESKSSLTINKKSSDKKNKYKGDNDNIEIQDIFNSIVEFIKEVAQKEFETEKLQIYHYEIEDNTTLTNYISNAIQYVFETETRSAGVPEKVLSIDLGTGYYMTMLNNIVDQYEEFKSYLFVKREKEGTDQISSQLEQKSSETNIDGKKSSAIYFFTPLNFKEVPQRISALADEGKKTQFGDLIKSTSIERVYAIDQASIKDSLWYSISHYKKYLYYTKNVIVDKFTMTSNVHLYHEGSGRYIDLLHIFLVFASQLYYVLRERVNTTVIAYDTLRISVPINAEECHKNFMIACFDYVFNAKARGSTGEKFIKIQITTEPESAFSFISQASEDDTTRQIIPYQASLKSEKKKENTTEDTKEMAILNSYLMDEFNHAVLIDGGDGTFDYLYVRKFNNIWSRQEQGAFNYAGSNIFEEYKKMIMPLIGEKKFQDTKLFYMIYDGIKKYLAQSNEEDKNDETKEDEKKKSGKKDNLSQHDAFSIVGVKIQHDPYGYSLLMKSWYNSFKEKKEFNEWITISTTGNQDSENLYKDFTEEQTAYEKQKIQIGEDINDPEEIQKILFNNNTIMQNVFKKHLQKINIIIKKKLLKVIISEPAKNFQDNYKEFMNRVQKRIQEKGSDGPIKMAHVFVGGLAASNTIAERMKQTCNEYINNLNRGQEDYYEFITVKNPQVSIVRGIPIQRADISLRDYTEVSPYNIYLLQTKKTENISKNSTVQWKDKNGNWKPFMKPDFGLNNVVKNVPGLLISKNTKLEPGKGKYLQGLQLKLGRRTDLTFYKSENTAPLFFQLDSDINREEGRINNVIPRECFHTVSIIVTKQGLSQEAYDVLQMDENIDNNINIQVYFSLDHVSFSPDPQIIIYGISPDNDQKEPIYKVPIWDWAKQRISTTEYEMKSE